MTKFQSGHKKRGGRKKGVQNKVTRTVKEAIQYALDQNADQLAAWLKKSGKRSGAAGVFAYTALAEFIQPKLARTEHTGKDGKDIPISVFLPENNRKKK